MPLSGTVTFLFSDIEGSTQLWEQYPQAMHAVMASHDGLLREAIASYHGTVVKMTGDGIHAVFGTATDALESALSAQRALLAQHWDETGALRVRMALHTGQAEWRDGDYYGPAVNRAARLMSIASGGQILLSAATAELARDSLPDGATLTDLGQHHLRSLDRPEQIYQLNHPDLPASFPPLPAAEAVPNNLPAQLTSFIGREQEIAALSELLTPGADSAAGWHPRLITLIGPGGTGKTRLSLEVATGLLDHFPDGVWLIELAPLADARLLAQAIATPLGLHEQPGRPLLDMLADYLRGRRLLLILDNCEHVIDACAQLAETLLRACPDLYLLASSREALGIAGEQSFRVRSLARPIDGAGLSVAELARYEAISLFVDRVAAVKPGFALTPHNAAAILQICQRLDGIPLALELAAARVRVLEPEQIAARLDDRFRLLTGGSRTALPRQRTLQALIDWSYDLLAEPECILLRRLSVFSGGWTLEAAEAIAGADPLEPFEVLDLLDQLVNKSLVATDETDLGQRYRMLETIRQYAQEKLAGSGEAADLRDRHLAYFAEQNGRVFEALLEMHSIELFTRFIPEADNLRAARAWALDHDLAAALDLALAVPRMNKVTPVAESLRYVQATIAQAESRPDFSGPDAPTKNRRRLATALASAANLSFGLGLNPQALEYAGRGWAVAEQVGDLRALSLASGTAGAASLALGDLEAANKWHAEALTTARQSGTNFMLGMAMINIFPFAHDPTEVEAQWAEGMALFRQGDDLWGQGIGYMIAAANRLQKGDTNTAQDYAERSLACFQAIGDPHFVTIPRSVLAELAWARGELDRAAMMYHEVIPAWRDSGNAGAVARCLEILAFIAQAQVRAGDGARPGQLAYAATLIGAAAALREKNRAPMTIVEQPEYDREVAAIRASTDDNAFQAAWQRGYSLDIDQAIAFALNEPS